MKYGHSKEALENGRKLKLYMKRAFYIMNAVSAILVYLLYYAAK